MQYLKRRVPRSNFVDSLQCSLLIMWLFCNVYALRAVRALCSLLAVSYSHRQAGNTSLTRGRAHTRPVGLALYGRSNRKSVGLPEAVA
eukprot:2667976-Pleurochrysis_carterae.AAC.3